MMPLVGGLLKLYFPIPFLNVLNSGSQQLTVLYHFHIEMNADVQKKGHQEHRQKGEGIKNHVII